jgi:hypothetical protein
LLNFFDCAKISLGKNCEQSFRSLSDRWYCYSRSLHEISASQWAGYTFFFDFWTHRSSFPDMH